MLRLRPVILVSNAHHGLSELIRYGFIRCWGSWTSKSLGQLNICFWMGMEGWWEMSSVGQQSCSQPQCNETNLNLWPFQLEKLNLKCHKKTRKQTNKRRQTNKSVPSKLVCFFTGGLSFRRHSRSWQACNWQP